MIQRLNEATRLHHAEAETEFDVLFERETTPGHYLKFLVRAYGFEAPLESMLALTPSLRRVIDLEERRKAGFIAEDLLALGLRPVQIAELPQCLGIPQFRGAAEALGWMYVVERTTLAHSIVRRHLLMRLPREIRHASNYLSCYAGVVGVRWRGFGAALDDFACMQVLEDRIAAAASEAFRCQRRWIQQDLQDRRLAI